jgi:hypothetical protein
MVALSSEVSTAGTAAGQELIQQWAIIVAGARPCKVPAAGRRPSSLIVFPRCYFPRGYDTIGGAAGRRRPANVRWIAGQPPMLSKYIQAKT